MIGVSTSCLSDVPLEHALDVLYDLTGIVEIVDDGLHFMDNADIAECFDFRYFIHAPSRGVNITSQLEIIRKASVEVIRQCAGIASGIDADRVIIHPGYFSHVLQRDIGIFQLEKSLIELEKISGEYSITFLVENMPEWNYFLLKRPEELPLIRDFGFVLDVGHANTNSCLDEFLEVPISHFHLHDNFGKEDSHLAPGKGNIDFGPVFDAIEKNDVPGILEVNTLESAKSGLEYIRKMRPGLF
ncbi:sugar phosphate isomerase/epimerase family protein [Methanolacinia petrolearia]|uniref:sugar phosphate isomerase/epimerase family protein n=1 Tax=Methanolacinia petrolearia TaxID=54120 RepID=UPI003BABA723